MRWYESEVHAPTWDAYVARLGTEARRADPVEEMHFHEELHAIEAAAE